jgi:hypothetical protein
MDKSTSDDLDGSPQPERLSHSERVRTWVVRALIALAALGLLLVYLMSPPTLHDPGAVAACLPRDITLTTVAEYRPTGTMSQVKNAKEFDYKEITVERKLAEIGAYASGGKQWEGDTVLQALRRGRPAAATDRRGRAERIAAIKESVYSHRNRPLQSEESTGLRARHLDRGQDARGTSARCPVGRPVGWGGVALGGRRAVARPAGGVRSRQRLPRAGGPQDWPGRAWMEPLRRGDRRRASRRPSRQQARRTHGARRGRRPGEPGRRAEASPERPRVLVSMPAEPAVTT